MTSPPAAMDPHDFDVALVTAAFRLAGEQGWSRVNVPAAAAAAGLSLAEARERFRASVAIVSRFSQLLDQAALAAVPTEGSVRDRLFDVLMRRFDALQSHRSGVLALLRALPCNPVTAMVLACDTRRSMRWMLQAAGVTSVGIRGKLYVRGLGAVWLWSMRAWQRDESEDLSATMAALDVALDRAESAAIWVHGRSDDGAATDGEVPSASADETGAVPTDAGAPEAPDTPPEVKDPPSA